MKWKVPVTSITDLYIIVEADTEDEAYELAKEADGSEFIEEGYGEWDVETPVPWKGET